jgi:drug/metabolite transporter (DMT)-like permease
MAAMHNKNIISPRWLPFLILAAGLLAVSLGGVLARIAQGQGVGSLAVATWRLGLAALLVTPVALAHARRELAGLTTRQLGLTLAAGLFLALHFGTWISSLEYTSVASSTALVSTTPLWIGLANFLLFRARPSRLMTIGIALSLAGSLFIFWADNQHAAPGRSPALGNFLAVAGSWSFAAYLLTGSRLRAGLSLAAYIWLAYGAASLILMAASLACGIGLTGYPQAAWLAVLGLALGPQLLGHTAYNWSLRHVSPTFVAVVALGEPVVGAALAFLLFGEGFTGLQAAGFLLLVAGIFFAARGERR